MISFDCFSIQNSFLSSIQVVSVRDGVLIVFLVNVLFTKISTHIIFCTFFVLVKKYIVS